MPTSEMLKLYIKKEKRLTSSFRWECAGLQNLVSIDVPGTIVPLPYEYHAQI